ncbi:hypothetical protein Tco_1035874, partial [Tanacetum coccineum]
MRGARGRAYAMDGGIWSQSCLCNGYSLGRGDYDDGGGFGGVAVVASYGVGMRVVMAY